MFCCGNLLCIVLLVPILPLSFVWITNRATRASCCLPPWCRARCEPPPTFLFPSWKPCCCTIHRWAGRKTRGIVCLFWFTVKLHPDPKRWQTRHKIFNHSVSHGLPWWDRRSYSSILPIRKLWNAFLGYKLWYHFVLQNNQTWWLFWNCHTHKRSIEAETVVLCWSYVRLLNRCRKNLDWGKNGWRRVCRKHGNIYWSGH